MRPKFQPNLSSDLPDETEARFYESLREGDIEKLISCWADDDEVCCVHPGGSRIIGIGAIRAAFEAMFSNGSIQVTPMRVSKLQSLSSCVHSVIEKIQVLTPQGPLEAYVIATNIYHKTFQGWRLVAHHASPGTSQEMQELHDVPAMLH